MRRPLLLLIVGVSLLLGGAVWLVSTLIALLFESGLQTAIDPEQLNVRSGWGEDRRPIPKIIHQTWKNETVPEMWSIAQYSCRDLHPDYQYIVASPLLTLFVLLMTSYGRMRRVGSLLRRSILGFWRPLIRIRIILKEPMSFAISHYIIMVGFTSTWIWYVAQGEGAECSAVIDVLTRCGRTLYGYEGRIQRVFQTILWVQLPIIRSWIEFSII
jgi:hypothetical protein